MFESPGTTDHFSSELFGSLRICYYFCKVKQENDGRCHDKQESLVNRRDRFLIPPAINVDISR